MIHNLIVSFLIQLEFFKYIVFSFTAEDLHRLELGVGTNEVDAGGGGGGGGGAAAAMEEGETHCQLPLLKGATHGGVMG